MARWAWIVGASVGVLALACGGDDSSDKSDPTTTDSPDGGTVGKSDAATSTGGKDAATSSSSCGVPGAASQSIPGCSDDDTKAYLACVDDACATNYDTCFGPKYKEGKFAGACADYLTCTSACGCDDNACVTACTRSTECKTCMEGFASCGTSCIGKLSCATGGADSGIDLADAGDLFADSGIDTAKTCADLKTCCDSLSGADQTGCNTVYTQYMSLGSSADLACAAAISGLCP